MEPHTAPAEEQSEIYLSWTSPSRLFKKRDKEYFTNIGAIVFLLAVILVFAREFALIAALFAVVFFVYVTSTVPPEEIKHKLTNLGLETADAFYRWDDLVDFWFEEQWGQVMLVVRPPVGVRLIMLLGDQDRDRIRDIVAKHIPFREKPEKSWLDNAASWVSKTIPLEKPV